MTVTQLSNYIRGVFDDEELLHDVTLVGEVAEVSYSDKHTYIVLAEDSFSVRCVHFASRDRIEKGMRVALKGSVRFYDKRNVVSFSYTEYYVSGEGDKNIKLAQLKQKLCSMGYFENRPELPEYITDVVLVTSPDGAAVKDFMRVVYDKCPFVRIRVYPVKVQGEGAAELMRIAINKLQSVATDAIVLCRGGGSDEDLDCFNDEGLATAVAQSVVPVISAVGHEINYTLCDFCAGTRAGTPSIAGEIVNTHASKIIADIYDNVTSLKVLAANKLAARQRNLIRLGKEITSAVSGRVLVGYKTAELSMNKIGHVVSRKYSGGVDVVNSLSERIKSGARNRLSATRAELTQSAALIKALDPHRIIKVGYAAVRKKNRRVATASELSVNDDITLVFADGTADATVKKVTRSAIGE